MPTLSIEVQVDAKGDCDCRSLYEGEATPAILLVMMVAVLSNLTDLYNRFREEAHMEVH